MRLTRVVLYQLGDRRGLLLFPNLFILLLVGSSLETLPRKCSSQKVEEDVSETFEIVSSGLLCPGERNVSVGTFGAQLDTCRPTHLDPDEC